MKRKSKAYISIYALYMIFVLMIVIVFLLVQVKTSGQSMPTNTTTFKPRRLLIQRFESSIKGSFLMKN